MGMPYAEGDVAGLVASYLDDRDRRFTRALDAVGFPHNGPRSVELHTDNALYCIPDGTYTREQVAGLFEAFDRESVSDDIMLLVDVVDGDDIRQAWPASRTAGSSPLMDLDPSVLPPAGLVLHLWLMLDPEVAEDDVRELLAAGEEPYWTGERDV